MPIVPVPCGRMTVAAFLLAAAVLARPAALRAEDAAVSVPTASVDGSLAVRSVVRTAEGGDGRTADRDLYADLRLDVRPGRSNIAGFHFLGALRSDLDGSQEPRSFFPFEDIGNTHDRRATGEIYEAYVALADTQRAENRVRIRRQAGTRNETVFFDGIAVDAGTSAVNVTLYSGAAVHFFDIDSHWGRDWLSGAGVDYRFASSAGMSADCLLVKDVQESAPGRPVLWDRLIALRGWQQVGAFSRYSASYRLLDGEPRDLSLQALSSQPAWDAEGTLGYLRQFRPQDVLSTDLALFPSVIGRSAPYQSIDVKVRKSFLERFSLDLGHFRRELLNPADEGPFDKEWDRTYAALDIADLFVPRLSWTVTAERWGGGSTDTTTYGTDLAWRVRRKSGDARVAAGTYYSRYKYDYYTDLGVREQVRTWYVEGKYPLGRGFSVNGRYERERATETYQVLRLGMRYDF